VAIQRYITGPEFDADTTRIMIDAYEAVLRALDLPSGHSPTHNRIADFVIRLTESGERDPQVISRQILVWMARPGVA
jgi:hypothetical protein